MDFVAIESVGANATERDVTDLAHLLLDAIDSGAGVSFMPGLTQSEAEAWWRSTLQSLPQRGALLVAKDAEGIVGTVQLHPAWAPNQPHRADVAKLIVHRRGRGRGVARKLMLKLEQHAQANGFTLLVLDTCRGAAAEGLYSSMGWIRAGVVPGFALNPDGSICDTVFMFKQLGPPA